MNFALFEFFLQMDTTKIYKYMLGSIIYHLPDSQIFAFFKTRLPQYAYMYWEENFAHIQIH